MFGSRRHSGGHVSRTVAVPPTPCPRPRSLVRVFGDDTTPTKEGKFTGVSQLGLVMTEKFQSLEEETTSDSGDPQSLSRTLVPHSHSTPTSVICLSLLEDVMNRIFCISSVNEIMNGKRLLIENLFSLPVLTLVTGMFSTFKVAVRVIDTPISRAQERSIFWEVELSRCVGGRVGSHLPLGRTLEATVVGESSGGSLVSGVPVEVSIDTSVLTRVRPEHLDFRDKGGWGRTSEGRESSKIPCGRDGLVRRPRVVGRALVTPDDWPKGLWTCHRRSLR